MGKGKELLGWDEPKEWLAAVKGYAKAEGIRVFPLKQCLITFAILGGVMFYHWSQADPEKRPSPLGALAVFAVLCAFLLALTRLMGALNKTRTSLREAGMFHGPADSRRWIPYGTIQAFTIEEEEIEGRRFRFLAWFEETLEEELSSVLPDTLDPRGVIEILKSKGVEHRVSFDVPADQETFAS